MTQSQHTIPTTSRAFHFTKIVVEAGGGTLGIELAISLVTGGPALTIKNGNHQRILDVDFKGELPQHVAVEFARAIAEAPNGLKALADQAIDQQELAPISRYLIETVLDHVDGISFEDEKRLLDALQTVTTAGGFFIPFNPGTLVSPTTA